MRQIGPGVGVSFKWETLTPGQNRDSGGLRLHTAGDRDENQVATHLGNLEMAGNFKVITEKPIDWEGRLSELFCVALCTEAVHSYKHT